MKTQKMITLDDNIIEKLRSEDNASALINSLLTAHYSTNNTIEGIIEDIDDEQTVIDEGISEKKRIDDAVKKRVAEMEKNKKEISFDNPHKEVENDKIQEPK